jgi:transcriptional regulator with XRE-family HTH domain
MATTQRRSDRARVIAADVRRKLGAEIRDVRVSAGLSLRAAAGSVGMSYSVLGRIERGVLANVTILQLSQACTAVGLRLSGKAYPDGDPIRDAGQARLLRRFEARLPPGTAFRRETPLPIPGDPRGIDGTATLDRRRTGVEAETHLADLQALERRALQKQRDAGLPVLILLVADTHHNRRVLALHREALRASFPLDTRAVMARVTRGLPPEQNGIVVL